MPKNVNADSRSAGALALAALLGAACGDAPEHAPGYQGILTVDPWAIVSDTPRDPTPDAAVEPADARIDDAADLADAPPDAAVADAQVARALPSNTPWAEQIYVGEGSNQGLVLRGSNFMQSPSSSEVYAKWLITVENEGSSPICSVLVYATFYGADDEELISFSATLDAPEHASGSLDVGCIPPGDTVPGWSNTFIPRAIDLDDIERIAYSFGGVVTSDARPILGPIISELTFDPAFGRRIGSGRVTNGPDLLQYPSVTIYPIDAAGMPLDRVSAIDSVYVSPYASWEFETSQSEVPIIASLSVLGFLRP